MREAIAVLLIVLWVIGIGASVLLVYGALRLRNPALQERATASVIGTIAATGGAVIACAYLGGVELPAGGLAVILIINLFAVSVPQAIWVLGYLAGRFR